MIYKKLLLLPLLIILISSCSKPVRKTVTKKAVVQKGDTITTMLAGAGIEPSERTLLISSFKKVFNPSQAKPDDYFEIEVDTSNVWHSFRYSVPKKENYYYIEKSTDGIISASEKKWKIYETEISTKGIITKSLWQDMGTHNIEGELRISFAEKFAWQIDFFTDTRVDDEYKLIWKEFKTENGYVIENKILAAQYRQKKDVNTAVLFTNSKGEEDYYDLKGESMRKAFLKAPLTFRRISSYFTKRRFHPILKYYRPHEGIDYAAPTGTPVDSVGDGRVIFAGWKGGYGKLIQIKHSNGYITYYGHLSKIYVKNGQRVKQGDPIGRVGSTGLSTGPHLDFRIKLNGKFFNYLNLKFPAAHGVTKKDKPAFNEVKKKALASLANIR